MQLERRPDQIIIITDDASCVVALDVKQSIYVKKVNEGFVNHAQVLANKGIELTNAQWIVKLDADDIIYPHALNPLHEIKADVLSFGVSVNGERNLYAPSVTAQDVLAAQDNLLFAASPFRRWVWEKSSGFQDMLYDDWAFWREAAANNATFASSGTIDYEYRLEGHNATMNLDHEIEKRKVFNLVH